jgi:S-adenosylmethionine:tRNA ribosyltransferase-isomerase
MTEATYLADRGLARPPEHKHQTVGPPFDPERFHLPPALEASSPPEARGLSRDAVRLMVAHRGDGRLEHHVFTDLPALLEPGDVVVVNTSATLPAALPATTRSGRPAAVHLSGRLPGGLWMVELRHRFRRAGHHVWDTEPWLDADAGTLVDLPDGGSVQLRVPAAAELGPATGVRLWIATLELPDALLAYLARHGRPIRYSYAADDWPIASYQTVFAEVPGSAEMPSAARPFSAQVTTRLVSRGVTVAPFVLHCGVSSPESHEPPAAEWFRVPPVTAGHVNSAHRLGHRVIAVGTTAVRALETVTDNRGLVHPNEGWTELVIDTGRKIQSVDGLITGWHEPGASHLSLLQAVAGPDLVAISYREALAQGYLWHEFGDSHLILP